MFTKQQVQNMVERDLRKQVLIPLLRAMNFEGVHEYHGSTEFGKDIVCWKYDELHNRENLALVVKATTVSGESKASADIENQVRQCYGKPYIDPITGASEEINRCWIVSNKIIPHDAVELIRAGIAHAVHQRSVRFVDIDALWNLIKEHMPLQATLQKLEEVRQDFDTFDTYYRLEAQVTGSGIHHTLVEKFPGAAQEKPLEIKSVFEFPDTEDGREHQQALQRFLDTGAPTKIPATYIKSIEYSEFLQHVYPAMTQDGFLQLGSLPHPKPLHLRCDIICDDGERFVLDYIRLTCTQAGLKEATLTNDGQPVPIRMQLVLRLDGMVSEFQISMDHDYPLNVHQILIQMRLLHCFSKPNTVRFTNLETGIFAGYCRSEAGICDALDENTLEALTALDALQIKSGRIVSLPNRELTDEEYQDIHMLRTLFRTGRHNSTWKSSSASIVVACDNREETSQMLRQLAEEGGVVCLQPEQDGKLSLFGEEYSLGPIKPLSLPTKLANWSEIRDLLDEGYIGELRMQLVPSDNGAFSSEYVQWLPEGGGPSAPDAQTREL